jgi:alpha-D-ribose 1-methylphosphonate 5-triphosphate synthase subunit PhnH
VLALFTGDISFYLEQSDEHAMNFIQRETAARPETADQADFLILHDANLLAEVSEVRVGSLSYPDMGATAIVQVEAISPAPLPGCLRLRLTGPGIEVETVVFVRGASELFFETRRELNAEFPMGLDAFLTCDSLSAGPCVLALPRTTRVDWERI